MVLSQPLSPWIRWTATRELKQLKLLSRTDTTSHREKSASLLLKNLLNIFTGIKAAKIAVENGHDISSGKICKFVIEKFVKHFHGVLGVFNHWK